MKIDELYEKYDREDHINPLNGGKVDPEFHDAMDYVEEVQGDLLWELVPDEDQRKQMSPKQRTDLIYQTEMKWFGSTAVDVDSLISTEPDYDPAHVKQLMNKPSSKLPRVYQYKGKRYVGDGNHRVLAAHFSGQKQVNVNLVDVDEYEHKLHTLIQQNNKKAAN